MTKPIGLHSKEELKYVFDRDSKPILRPLSAKMKKKISAITERDLVQLRNGISERNGYRSDGTTYLTPSKRGRLPKEFFHMNGVSLKQQSCPDMMRGIDRDEVNKTEEKYFVKENGHIPKPTEGIIKEGTFAGRRDVLNPRTIEEQPLISTKGTVRGFKNRVRAGIATFLNDVDENDAQNSYKLIERGKIIVYLTSMSIIRKTHEQCKKVKRILQNHMVRYEERDVYMNKDHQRELIERIGSEEVEIPKIFADGHLLGGTKELEVLNETGELRKILQHFTKIQVKSDCSQCGGFRFIPCLSCHGSKKSHRRNNFTDEFHALRCMQCNENGLVRCDLCLDQQE